MCVVQILLANKGTYPGTCMYVVCCMYVESTRRNKFVK